MLHVYYVMIAGTFVVTANERYVGVCVYMCVHICIHMLCIGVHIYVFCVYVHSWIYVCTCKH